MFKKGSLSISTNAIVVLIIAVVMLGLIMGLVTRGFGLVEDRFFSAISDQPNPPSPSGSQHITMNSETVRASSGERIGFKIAVLNTNDNPITITPANIDIQCSPRDPFSYELENPTDLEGNNNREVIFLTQVIEPGNTATFSYAVQLKNTLESDLYLCALKIEGLTYGEGSNAVSQTVRGQANFQIQER